MKLLIKLLLLASVMTLPMAAQFTNPVSYASSAPSGSCATNSIRMVTIAGVLYTCQNGTWGVASLGGGTGPTRITVQTTTDTSAPVGASQATIGVNTSTGIFFCTIFGGASCLPTYTLPTASAGTLGGIKIGSGLSIDGAGVVTASGGNITTTGTFAALPASGTTPGDMYIFTDAGYSFARWNGSSWDYHRDGQKVTRIDLSTWTLASTTGCNVTGALTTTYGHNTLIPGTTDGDTRVYYTAAPATPYTRTFQITEKTGSQTHAFVGVGFRQGSGANVGRLQLLGLWQNLSGQYGPYLSVSRWSDCTSVVAEDYSLDQWWSAPVNTYLQIGDTGTNLTFKICTDGRTCETLYTVARTTYADQSQTGQIVIYTRSGGARPPYLNVYGTLE